ncbi:MAG TPA: FAD binding domain-containing protein, partial [Candidatus Limnocylindria bacterium]
MIPRFSLTRPRTLAEAFAAHRAGDGDAVYFAGGTELLQVMKMGFAQFGVLIDLKAIDEIRGLEVASDSRLRIGAATTHRELERSPLVRESFPALAALEARVANVRVRNTGTIGGNLAFAEPHSDPATFLLACGATVELAGPNGRRELTIGEFLLGPLFTAREPDEVLVAIHIPMAAPSTGRAYDKIAFFERPAASVGVALTVADRAVRNVTVAVGSLTEVPTVVSTAGAAFRGAEATEEGLDEPVRAAIDAFGGLDIVADLNGSADYKRHLAGVLLGRAVRGA